MFITFIIYRTPGSELLQKSKPKRKRKTKIPPNADLSKTPDPER